MQRQLNSPVLSSLPSRTKTSLENPVSHLLNKLEVSPNSARHDFAKMPVHPDNSKVRMPKLKIHEPGDRYEQEADLMAEKATGHDQQRSSPKLSKQLNKTIHVKTNTIKEKNTSITLPEQKEATHKNETDPQNGVHEGSNQLNYLDKTQGKGYTLPSSFRDQMEKSFHFDFSSVRIHHDSKAAQMSSGIQARAFTHGQDIYFNSGQYNPAQTEGKHLLAHELTHVVQQSSVPSLQQSGQRVIQRSVFGWLKKTWQSFVSLLGFDPDYDDKTIQDFLGVLDGGTIEGKYDSDNKARVAVKRWKKGTLVLTKERRVMLIKEMIDGPTGNDDENAILDILKGSPGELTFILDKVKPKELRDEFHGSEFDELDNLLKAWEKRTGTTKAEQVNPTDKTLKNKDELLGDGTDVNPGLTLGEFETYISQQANWFTEDSLKVNEFIRNKLWDASILITEGNHTRDSLGSLKLDDVVKSNEDDLKLMREYAEGAKDGALTVKIERHLTDSEKVIKLGEAMKTLKSFLPGVVIQVAINESTLHQLVNNDLMDELIKYYKEWQPTFEHPDEGRHIITLLEEGVATYDEIKWWMRDLHIVTKATRLKMLENVKDKSRSKPLLLVLMSAVDHNTAFLQGNKLEEAILNTKNLALLLQGQKSLKEFETKANKIADVYGVKPDAKSKGQIAQVIIAGHGNANLVQLASSGKNPTKKKIEGKEEYYVDYDQEKLSPRSKGDPSEELIDGLLKRMDPNDAHFVFAGCLVGSHYTPSPGELKDTKKAAKVITKSIKDNPNLRDIVYERMKKLKIKKGDVQAGRGSATFSDFGLDASGRAMVGSPSDPTLGGSKDEYVKDGREPEGALRAAVETWADEEKFGAKWTTKAMQDYVDKYKDDKDFWRTTTKTAYEVALKNVLKDGNVDPAYLSDLSKRVEPWLNCNWQDHISPKKLYESVKPTEREHVFKSILDSDLGKNSPYVQIVIYQLWAKTDPTKAPLFFDAVDKTHHIENSLTKFIDPTFVDPLLPTLLVAADPANPTKVQLKLALAIAADRGSSMPEPVKKLLKDAAGNKTTTSFPPALNVKDFLEGTTELTILRSIGLAPGVVSEIPSAPEPSADPKAPAKFDKDANADLDTVKGNESLVNVKPVKFVLRADSPVWEKASLKSPIIDTLKKGTVIRVAGTFAGWALIDHGGTPAFVDLTLVAELK